METELLNYIISCCRKWMMPEEKSALDQIGLPANKAITGQKKIELMYGPNNDKVNYLISLGEERLRLSIAERIYKEHYSEAINLCPKCGKLARTAYAKQCRVCGHDWH